jgi:hypothetical protein
MRPISRSDFSGQRLRAAVASSRLKAAVRLRRAALRAERALELLVLGKSFECVERALDA